MMRSKSRWLVVVVFALVFGVLAVRLAGLLERSGDELRRPALLQAPAGSAELESTPMKSTDEISANAPAAEREETLPQAAENEREQRSTVMVQVRDAEDGRPIEGARVRLFDAALTETCVTDENGVSFLVASSRPKTIPGVVEAQGFCDAHEEFELTNSHVVWLERAIMLCGRVLAADNGGPVSGANLIWLDEEAERAAQRKGRQAISEIDGSYELGPLPRGRPVSLLCEAEGFAPAVRRFTEPGAESRTRRDIHLERGHEIRGRVEDWRAERGLAGAQVGWLTCDSDGNFAGRIATAPGPRVELTVRAEGHAELAAVLALEPEREWLFRLPGCAFIDGMVRGAGVPLSAVEVEYASPPLKTSQVRFDEPFLRDIPEGWTYSLPLAQCRSDADGRFHLPVLPWSADGWITATLQGFQTTHQDMSPIGAPDSVRTRDLGLKPCEDTRLRGVVRFNGVALPALCGTIAWRGPTRSGSAPFPLPGGGYELVVESGELELTVIAVALRDHPAEFSVRVEEGEQRVFDLDLLAPTGPITGSVRFANGDPVAGAWVEASCPLPLANGDGVRHQALTNAEGAYELHAADLGLSFVVSVTSPVGWVATRERVSVGATDIDFTLRQEYHARLRVVDAATGDVLHAGRDFAACRGVWTLALGEPDIDGGYSLWSPNPEFELFLVPGQDALTRFAPRSLALDLRRPPSEIDARLDAGESLTLELRSPLWTTPHELWLVEEGHADTVGPYVRGAVAALKNLRRVRFGDDGRAVQRALQPGEYRFVVRPDDLELDPPTVSVGRYSEPIALEWRPRW